MKTYEVEKLIGKKLEADIALIRMVRDYTWLKYNCSYDMGFCLLYKDWRSFYIGGSNEHYGYIRVGRWELIAFHIRNSFKSLFNNIGLLLK